ncbi:anaphase-promoting complex, subunit 10 [Exidia glandulosa HHB12029]|uniref:Anaphase-promoting complex subunit 10 n=1 Tax=Exidia glandulosa HHB12029 TaxID=1314781 RepID=A0A165R2P1_EXIGL|nr:anaphase-promoting complex, subunit 10 [Exidia glandulosa HHB12029]
MEPQPPTDPTIRVFPPGQPLGVEYPDIGDLGTWTVSSFKFGFGTECLRDNDPSTFWHSDGPQPHFVTVHFLRRVSIQKLGLYLAFSQDDSYTPQSILVRAGTGLNDLQDVRTVVFDKPTGWVIFDVSLEHDEDGESYKPLSAYVVQVVITENHMKGKDTHIRGMKVLGPVEEFRTGDDPFPFTTLPFKMYETIR